MTNSCDTPSEKFYQYAKSHPKQVGYALMMLGRSLVIICIGLAIGCAIGTSWFVYDFLNDKNNEDKTYVSK